MQVSVEPIASVWDALKMFERVGCATWTLPGP
jgi:hypothetical protein